MTDAKRGSFSRAMKVYEGKLFNAVAGAIEQGVNMDEVQDEAFALSMERR